MGSRHDRSQSAHSHHLTQVEFALTACLSISLQSWGGCVKFISFVQYAGFSKPEQCGKDGSSAGYTFFFPNPEVIPAVDCRSPFSYVLFSFWGCSGKDRLTCSRRASSPTLMQRSSPPKKPCRFSLGSMLVKGCLGKAGQETCPLPQSTLEETPLLPVLGSLILSNASLLRQDCHHSLH